MGPRTWLSSARLSIGLALLAGCRAAPVQSGPPTTSSGWALAPDFGSAAPAGRNVHVTCEDPVRSKVGERIASALTAALEAKGYTTVALPSEADFLVRLVVRYLGRSTPPDGHADVVARASETILAGDAGWLASDGSGFDTEVRKPRGLHSRPKVRGFWGELFQGHEDDEWTLLVDLAVGTRSSDAPELVRRHDGRLWAQADAFALDRATATELLLTELEERLGESVP